MPLRAAAGTPPDGRPAAVRLRIRHQETTDGRSVFVAQLVRRSDTTDDMLSPPAVESRVGDELVVASVPAVGERVRRTSDADGDMSATERLTLLADTDAELSSTLEPAEAPARVGRLVTRRLADRFVVDTFTEYGQVDRVRVVHRDPREGDPRRTRPGSRRSPRLPGARWSTTHRRAPRRQPEGVNLRQARTGGEPSPTCPARTLPSRRPHGGASPVLGPADSRPDQP